MSEPIEEVKNRVRRKTKFYKELITFVTTSIFLIGLNIFTSPGYMWAWWPIGFWGIGLVSKAIKLTLHDKASDWEEREINREMKRRGYESEHYSGELDLDDLPQPIYSKGRNYKSSDLV